MKLFSFWRSLATYRVRIALNLKGLTPEIVEVDLMKGDQRDDKFRAVNPMMAIPALVDGDGRRCSSRWRSSNTRRDTSEAAAAAERRRKRAPACAAWRRSSAADSHPLIVPRVREYLGARIQGR